jgi:hypothetical protein
MTDISDACPLAVLFDVSSVSAVEAAGFLALVVVALVVIGVLFAVFLRLDERAR